MTTTVGLDIGATKILGVVVDDRGEIVAQVREQTSPGAEGVLASAAAVVRRLGDISGLELTGPVGVGIPGLVDVATGTVAHAVNLDLAGDPFPLAERLAERLGLSVVVDNDLNAATLGAHVLSGVDDLAYLSLGTGLAAGLVLDGRIRRGSSGAAGEIGHVPVDRSGVVCQCGQRGCLETIASGSAITTAWPVDGRPAAQALFAAADLGTPAAVAARDAFLCGVADAIRMLCLAVDPGTVILGGGVAALGEPLRLAVQGALRQQAAGSAFLATLDLAARVRVVPADVPVAALGAALLGTHLTGG